MWTDVLDLNEFYGSTLGQMTAGLLRANMFAPMRQSRALFMPPTRSRLALRMAPAFERFGQRWLGRFAGVSVIEAGKQLYAGVAERTAQPELAIVRPKLRVAHSRDTHASRNRKDGEAPVS